MKSIVVLTKRLFKIISTDDWWALRQHFLMNIIRSGLFRFLWARKLGRQKTAPKWRANMQRGELDMNTLVLKALTIVWNEWSGLAVKHCPFSSAAATPTEWQSARATRVTLLLTSKECERARKCPNPTWARQPVQAIQRKLRDERGWMGVKRECWLAGFE